MAPTLRHVPLVRRNTSGPLLSANSKRRRTLRWVLIMMCGLLLVSEVLMEFRMMRKKRQTSITSSSSFQKIWRQSNLGRLDFAWDVNATEWTSFNTGRFNQLWKNNNYRSEGIRKIIRAMDPPKNDDGLCSGQVILNDVGSWQTWEKVPDGLEPTTPTFVVQMPTRRSDSSQCLRLIPNPFELEGTDNYVARFPPFSQRRQQVMYRGTVWGDRNMKQSPQTKLQRQQIFDMGADAANADWLNATPERTRKNVIGTYRYLLDVGGVDGTTWSALRWKMAIGSLVFKVDSDRYNWFHTIVRPYVHYIPVKSDLTDLHAQYMWAIDHPADAERIAKAGQEVAISLNRTVFHHKTREIIAETIDRCCKFPPTTTK